MRIAWLCVLISLSLSEGLTFAQGADEAALKAVVQAQAKAWVERDANAAQRLWVHDHKATRAVVDAGGYVFQRGWEDINAAAQKSYQENTKPLDFTVAIEKSWPAKRGTSRLSSTTRS
jgi:hypothetical protein